MQFGVHVPCGFGQFSRNFRGMLVPASDVEVLRPFVPRGPLFGRPRELATQGLHEIPTARNLDRTLCEPFVLLDPRARPKPSGYLLFYMLLQPMVRDLYERFAKRSEVIPIHGAFSPTGPKSNPHSAEPAPFDACPSALFTGSARYCFSRVTGCWRLHSR